MATTIASGFNTLKNIEKPYWWLLGIAFITALFNSPITHEPNFDVEVYRYIGMLINKGFTPYKDVFEHKPPMVYFIAAIAHVFGIWGNWFIALVGAYFASILLYKLSKHFKITLAIIIPIVFLLLLNLQGEVRARYADTRYFTTLFNIVILYLVVLKTERLFLFKGVLVGIVFFTQQNEILISALLLAYNFKLLFDIDSEKALKAFGLMSAGFFIVIGIFLIYFLITGSLDDFYNCVYRFNVKYFKQKLGLKDHLHHLKDFFIKAFSVKFFVLLGLTFGAYIAIKKTTQFSLDFLVFTVLVAATSVYNITLSGYYWYYYTFHLILPIVMLLLVLTYWINPLMELRFAYWSFLAILVFAVGGRRSMLVDGFKAFKNYGFSGAYNNFHKGWKTTFDTLKANDNAVYIFNETQSAVLLNKYNIKAPGKWMLSFFWEKRFNEKIKFDLDGEIFKNEILQKVIAAAPIYIISYKKIEGGTYEQRKDIEQLWYNFLDHNYIPYKPSDGDSTLWLYKRR
jgi:hypothetical protein